VDVDALDRAAARFAGSASPGTGSSRKLAAAAALSTATAAAPVPRSRPPESIFGGDLLSEKSLDEVILSYLASDLDEVEE
jgi:hypothetical protein